MSTSGSHRQPGAQAHELFDELAVGHALSALEPEDEVLFTAHLSGCPDCQRAVAEHTATLAQLGSAVRQEEPPASLLDGIRAGVRDEVRAASAGPAPPAAPAGAQPGARDDLAGRRSRAVQVRRSHLLASAAAVVALLIGLGGWNAVLQRDNAQQGARVENLAGALQALQSPESRTVRLASPEGAVLAVAVLEGEQLSLVVDGLEPNDPESVYVMWGQTRDGDLLAVDTFDVERAELDVLRGLRLDADADDLTMLMVTREPGRTLPETTSQQVLVSGAV